MVLTEDGRPGAGVVAADHVALRRNNLSVVLRHVRDQGPRSRARIAADTGLNKATVSSLVAELVDRRLLREGRAEVERGVLGRPGQLVELDGAAVCGVGAEINVEFLAVTALDLAGELVFERRVPMAVARLDPATTLDKLAALIRVALAAVEGRGGSPAGVTLAVPGLVQSSTGVLKLAPNLGWTDLPVVEEMRGRLGEPEYPIRVDNEANLAALAEYKHITTANPAGTQGTLGRGRANGGGGADPAGGSGVLGRGRASGGEADRAGTQGTLGRGPARGHGVDPAGVLGRGPVSSGDGAGPAGARGDLGSGLVTGGGTVRDLVLLTGGVGVGGGVVADGHLLRGRHGFSGEVGHMPVAPDSGICGCGRTGCWETVVGLTPLLHEATDVDDPVRDPALDVEQRLAELTSRAEAGNPRMLRALADVGTWLGVGGAVLVTILNPDVLVLGGYFAVLGRWLRDPLDTALRDRVIAPGGCRVVESRLGFTAAVRGGAQVALDQIFADPTLAGRTTAEAAR